MKEEGEPGEDGRNYPLHFQNCHFFTRCHANAIRSQAFAATSSAKVTAQNRANRAGGPHFFADDPPKSFVGSLPPSHALRANAYCAFALGSPENLSDNMSDILYEQQRRSSLSILKAPPKQPKTVTVQARVEESVKTQLERYAEFIDTSPSYVITEALKLLFRKDHDFRRWADQHANNHNNEKAKGDALAKAV